MTFYYPQFTISTIVQILRECYHGNSTQLHRGLLKATIEIIHTSHCKCTVHSYINTVIPHKQNESVHYNFSKSLHPLSFIDVLSDQSKLIRQLCCLPA